MPESSVFPGFFGGLDLKPDFWKSSVFLYENISTAKCVSGCNLGLDVTIWDSGLDVKRGYTNWNLTEWPGRDVFSDGLPVMGCIRPDEIIPVEQKIKLEMHSAGWNNPCGTKEPDRDASDRGKVIPVEQKSPIEMHPGGRNNPCGTKESDRDAFSWAK